MRFRILLAEDNPSHAKLITRILQKYQAGLGIVHVSDGEAAIDYLLNEGDYQNTKQYPRPDLVLLDLRLPKIDGLVVLKTIRATPLLRTLPVVILSTSNAEPEVQEAYELNATSYLVKPVDNSKFTDLLMELTSGNILPHRNIM